MKKGKKAGNKIKHVIARLKLLYQSLSNTIMVFVIPYYKITNLQFLTRLLHYINIGTTFSN